MTSDRWQLLRGDCLSRMASLPDGSIDCAITDPPYSAHVHEAARRGHAGYEERQSSSRATFSRTRELGFDALTPDVRRAAAAHLARLTRRWVLVFSDHEGSTAWGDDLAATGLEVVRYGVWIKAGATPQFTGDRPAVGHEVIVIAHRPGKKRWNGGGHHGVWTVPIVLNRGENCEQRVHTTQKPLVLMEALVRDFTEPNEMVIDPFAGSATTGVACLRLGRRFLGVELDQKYAAVATRRLATAKEQGALF